jgi:hypothetical protein
MNDAYLRHIDFFDINVRAAFLLKVQSDFWKLSKIRSTFDDIFVINLEPYWKRETRTLRYFINIEAEIRLTYYSDDSLRQH